MALLSLEQLGVELRIIGSTTTPFPVGQESIVTNLHAFVFGLIEDRAPDAPEWAKNQAAIVLAGYEYNKPPSSEGRGYGNVWTNSGAETILGKWIEIKTIPIESTNTTSNLG